MSTVEEDEQDPTRGQRREPARAQPTELEQGDAKSGPRRTSLRRVWIAVVSVVAIAIVVLIAVGGGSKKGTPAQSNGAQAIGASAAVTSLLAGIPQRGNTLGDPNAPVSLQYFGDLQCPYCRHFTLSTLPSLIQSYVRSGKLKVEYRSLETATRDPQTFKTQQVAALAAGTQNKLWDFIYLFYGEQGRENSGYVTERYLQGLAKQVSGLNLVAWSAARNDAGLANAIAADARTAGDAGINRTPSFLLNRAGAPFASAIRERLLKG